MEQEAAALWGHPRLEVCLLFSVSLSIPLQRGVGLVSPVSPPHPADMQREWLLPPHLTGAPFPALNLRPTPSTLAWPLSTILPKLLHIPLAPCSLLARERALSSAWGAAKPGARCGAEGPAGAGVPPCCSLWGSRGK